MYRKPQLIRYGSLRELTLLGGDYSCYDGYFVFRRRPSCITQTETGRS